MNPSNYLNIPQYNFGMSGINTANLIYKSVKTMNSNAIIEYDPRKKHIIIKNLAKVTVKKLGEILYNKEQSAKYHGWYPQVEEEKDFNGNFLIKLFARSSLGGDMEKLFGSPRSFFMMPTESSQSLTTPKEKVKKKKPSYYLQQKNRKV